MQDASCVCISLTKWQEFANQESLTPEAKNDINRLCGLLTQFTDMECPNQTNLLDNYIRVLIELEAIVLEFQNHCNSLDCSPLLVSKMLEEKPEDRLIIALWSKDLSFTTKKLQIAKEDVDFQGGRRIRQKTSQNHDRTLQYQCSTPKKNIVLPWSRSLLKLQNSRIWIIYYRPKRLRGSNNHPLAAQISSKKSTIIPQFHLIQHSFPVNNLTALPTASVSSKQSEYPSAPVSNQNGTPNNKRKIHYYSPSMFEVEQAAKKPKIKKNSQINSSFDVFDFAGESQGASQLKNELSHVQRSNSHPAQFNLDDYLHFDENNQEISKEAIFRNSAHSKYNKDIAIPSHHAFPPRFSSQDFIYPNPTQNNNFHASFHENNLKAQEEQFAQHQAHQTVSLPALSPSSSSISMNNPIGCILNQKIVRAESVSPTEGENPFIQLENVNNSQIQGSPSSCSSPSSGTSSAQLFTHQISSSSQSNSFPITSTSSSSPRLSPVTHLIADSPTIETQHFLSPDNASTNRNESDIHHYQSLNQQENIYSIEGNAPQQRKLDLQGGIYNDSPHISTQQVHYLPSPRSINLRAQILDQSQSNNGTNAFEPYQGIYRNQSAGLHPIQTSPGAVHTGAMMNNYAASNENYTYYPSISCSSTLSGNQLFYSHFPMLQAAGSRLVPAKSIIPGNSSLSHQLVNAQILPAAIVFSNDHSIQTSFTGGLFNYLQRNGDTNEEEDSELDQLSEILALNHHSHVTNQQVIISVINRLLNCKSRTSFDQTVSESVISLTTRFTKNKFYSLVNLLQNSSWMRHFSPLTSQSRLLIYSVGCIDEMESPGRAVDIFRDLFEKVFKEKRAPYYENGFWFRPFTFIKKLDNNQQIVYNFVSTEAAEVIKHLRLKLQPKDTVGRPDADIFDENFAFKFQNEDISLLGRANLFLTDNSLPLPCKLNCGNCKVIASKIHFRIRDESYIFACATAVQCSSSLALCTY